MSTLLYIFKQDEEGELLLMDLTSKVLSEIYLPANKQEIISNFEYLSSGTYLLQIRSQLGFTKTEKLIITH